MLLELLRQRQGFVSGGELGRQLRISGQELWERIQALRERGYEIESVPHLGYKLASCPDRLYPEEITAGLGTQFLGRTVHYFESTSSTMDEAMRLGAESPDGTVIVAESQEKGRGRLGRSWFSPGHKGIYCSIILKPDILPSQAPVLALVASVGVCEAIGEAAGVKAGIKWPNDILVGDRKLAGILTELKAELDRVVFVVIGIGLNANNDAGDLFPGSASLRRETGEEVRRIAVVQAMLRKVEQEYLLFRSGGGARVLEKWKSLCVTLGRKVRIDCLREHVEGEAVDIDSDGGLLVRRDAGIVQKFMAGDISHLR